MPSLFISYSRKNQEFVRKLHDALLKDGNDVWVDFEDIPPSVDWQNEIYRGIEAADAFIFVISPPSVNSKACRDEIDHALKNSKRIIPVMYQMVTEQADFDAMHPIIKSLNWTFITDQHDFDTGYKTLAQAIRTDFEYVRQHTRLLVRANEWVRYNRDADYLLRGDDLKDAELWLAQGASTDPRPAPLHAEYIVASEQARSAFQRTRLGFLSLVLLLTLGLLVITFFSFQSASNERDQRATAEVNERNSARFAQTQQAIAERQAAEIQSRALVSAADNALQNENSRLAILLALEANNIQPPLAQAQRALAAAAYNPGARRLYREEGRILDVAVSPDGKNAVTSDDNGTVIVWEVATGLEIRRLASGTRTVNSVAISPDGQFILAGNSQGDLVLWTLGDGEEVRRWDAHVGEVYVVKFDPTTPTIAASSGRDQNVILWDITSGTEIRRFEGNTEAARSLAFYPDGSLLMSGGDRIGGRVVMWEVSTGEVVLSRSIHNNTIHDIAFSPDGSQVLTASEDGALLLWNMQTQVRDGRLSVTFARSRQLMGAESSEITIAVNGVAFSPDGFTAVSVTDGPDQSLSVWDVRRGIRLYRLDGHTNNVTSVAYAPNGLRVLTGSDDRTMILWDVESGALVARFDGHTAEVDGVVFSPDGNRAFSVSADTQLIVWDAETSERLGTFSDGQSRLTSVAVNHDGTLVAAGTNNGTILVWDVGGDGTPRTFVGHTDRVNSLDFSPDGQRLISGGQDRQLLLWDVERGEPMDVIFQGHSGAINSVAFSPDGTRILSGSRDSTMILWDANIGRPIIPAMRSERGSVTSIAFSPDGQTALASAFRTMLLWDLNTGEIIRVFEGHRSNVNSVAFDPKARYAMSGGSDTTIILWDVESGEEVFRLDGHRNGVTSVVFDNSGGRALSAGNDNRVILWRIDSLDALIQWTFFNRFVGEFSCLEREQFNLTPCAEEEPAPTRTLFPTLTPTSSQPLGTLPPS